MENTKRLTESNRAEAERMLEEAAEEQARREQTVSAIADDIMKLFLEPNGQ